jgi:RNase P/RNase MRP subunit p30
MDYAIIKRAQEIGLFKQTASRLGNDIFFMIDDPSIRLDDNIKTFGCIIKESDLKKFKRPKTCELVICRVEDDVGKAMKNPKVDGIIGQESIHYKENTHQRHSGLNHILCRLASEKNKKVCFSFEDILTCKSKKQRAMLLGRIRQNIKLCKKYKTTIITASFASDPNNLRPLKDIHHFFRI